MNTKMNQPTEADLRPDGGDNPSDPGHAGRLRERRQAGEELLAAGDAIINRTLSGNSQAFLAANRQQGGQ